MRHPRAAHAIINAYVLAFFDRYVKTSTSKELDTPLLSGQQHYPGTTVLRNAKKEGNS
ncbi:hypothetical protein [Thauera sp. SDU_THAU2]|uniref:hypothetical protein n=1 Tax=Thauera sp. SDU_THAU2 TaxID=3136633 RepID=UPI00311EF8C1